MYQIEKETRQVSRSKSWILESLLQLMEAKPFTDITITEICDRAGVGRQTLYRRFKRKEDILIDQLNKSFANYLESLVAQYGETPSTEEIITEAFDYWRKNERLNKLLLKHQLTNLFFTSLESHFLILKENNFFQAEMDTYLPEFAVGGIFFVILSWIKSGMKESSEEMGKVVSGFIHPKYVSS